MLPHQPNGWVGNWKNGQVRYEVSLVAQTAEPAAFAFRDGELQRVVATLPLPRHPERSEGSALFIFSKVQ
jgi:hypothetical protein